MRPSEIGEFLDGVIAMAQQGEYVVPFITGSPGVGKSALINSTALKNGYTVADIRLSIKEPVDLTGVAYMQDGRTYFAPAGWIPTEGKVLILLDEFPQSLLPMMNAAGNLVYDRKVGDIRLGPDVVIVLAGNRTQDRAGTQRVPQQMNNRLIHVTMDAHYPDWRGWAVLNGIHPLVIAFHDWQQSRGQDILSVPSPDANAFPSPRAWEFVSTIVKMHQREAIRNPTITGTVGSGAGSEFVGFMDAAAGIVPWKAILATPKTAALPGNISAAFALMQVLARRVDVDTMDALTTYLARLDKELGNLCITDAGKIKPVVRETAAYGEWVRKNRIAA